MTVAADEDDGALAHIAVPKTMAKTMRRTSRASRGGNGRIPQENFIMQLFGRCATIRSAAIAAVLLATAVASASCQQKPGPTDGQMTVMISGDSGSRSFN